MNFDISAHIKSCYLMEDDITHLNKLGIGRLCGDAESLLGQVPTLVCLTNAKLKEGENEKKKKIEQIVLEKMALN